MRQIAVEKVCLPDFMLAHTPTFSEFNKTLTDFIEGAISAHLSQP